MKPTYEELQSKNAELSAQLNNALEAFNLATKRIDKLEKYNLDLASESFNKGCMIDIERSKNSELLAQVELLRIAALNAVQSMSGGKAKADLRDAYDTTPAACLARVRADAVSEFIQFMYSSSDCQLCEKSLNTASEYAERIKQGGTE